MDSKYAFIHFIDGINETDETKNGVPVHLNYPIHGGETNLMRVAEYNKFMQDFPERIKGNIIKQENLINVVNFLYEQLKKEIDALPEIDEHTRDTIEYLKSEFEVDGILKPDDKTEDSVNDLANKYLILQDQVRQAQRLNVNKSSYHC